jgi:6-phosphogluconate dehydrogenase
MNTRGDIGVVGLAVMGANLALNMADHGFTVVVYNRTAAKTNEFLSGPARGKSIIGARSLEEMIGRLERPRKIMLMVKAGSPVDDFTDVLLRLLQPGDCIIDGGNSHFTDSMRRAKLVEAAGLLYVGCGVSGGEEGARNGPSLMPGGSAAAWQLVKPIFQSICAKTPDGVPCCDWVGENGAGHFVKMTHNGIEYGDLQLIGESYQFLRDGLGMEPVEMSKVLSEWNRGELNSYLVEITAHILGVRDQDESFLVDKILDVSGQKGTGKWISVSSLDLGVPVTLIAEAVFSRCLSAKKGERVLASKALAGPDRKISGEKQECILNLRDALFASKIISYAQGFMLLRQAAVEFSWNLDLGNIALMWRAGCIIRSVLLDGIKEAFNRDKTLPSLLLDRYFSDAVARCQDGWRKTVAAAALAGIPVPALSAGLAFYDGYRCNRLPANLLQAQRDYFGAHTYERTDSPRGRFFHTDWTGRGGQTFSGSYNA